MIQPHPAGRNHRFAAAAINLVIGMLPLSIPNLIFACGGPNVVWAKNDSILDGIIAGLAVIQFFLVHRMQGSPGAVFVGLRVQYLDGTPPRFKTTFARAIPYLVAVIASILMPREGQAQTLVSVLAFVYLGIITFAFASGVTFLVTGTRSILDRLTGTEVVKAYGKSMQRK